MANIDLFSLFSDYFRLFSFIFVLLVFWVEKNKNSHQFHFCFSPKHRKPSTTQTEANRLNVWFRKTVNAKYLENCVNIGENSGNGMVLMHEINLYNLTMNKHTMKALHNDMAWWRRCRLMSYMVIIWIHWAMIYLVRRVACFGIVFVGVAATIRWIWRCHTLDIGQIKRKPN